MSDSLKCSFCQDIFKNKELLTKHCHDVDCQIRCAVCRQEFLTKSQRATHIEEVHSESRTAGNPFQFMEIDDATWKNMMENVKKFTAAPKPGDPNYDSDSKIAKWIASNTPRYMMGRPNNAKAYLELGQWYIMFLTFASPDNTPPEHPC